MEKKSLYIYKLDEQGNKVKFPNSDMPAKLGEYTYSAQRMAGTPTLTATLNYPSCLDDFWTGEEFVEFRGEKYYVDQVPTSSKDNKSIMYKHELQFVSERIVLENVYFMDVVTAGADTYHSNSTSVKFMGDIHEFVGRLNASMTKSGIGYSVVIDDEITSDSKLVSLENVYLADALQSIYTIYELPYYFVGKVCHIGYTENVISTPFEYRKGLVSIKKTNANYKIVNRVTGVGSSDNIPFYYPNDDETGTIERSQNLMPSIYRQTSGAERFYNALNDTYKIPGTNDYYSFKNTYSAKKVKEIKVDFSDIKPTIEGVTNASGQLFGEIADIAFDANDSDELGTGEGNNVFNGTDEYVHSYFYIKLHIYNGDYGFNLFEQGLEGGTAVINMTTGNCAACEFEIGVTYKEGETRAYNPVLLGPTGNLIPGDFEQKVTSDTLQYVSSQQDTSKNEVWIAVKKDNSSFGVVMPNATNNYRPSVGDKFVITGIKMPKSLVLAAEKRLEEALIKYMSENNDEKFTFSVNFSRIFLAENTYLWDILNENARIYIKYNNREYLMYVNSYTCKADKNCLYDISVELTDKLSANVSALRSTITEIAGDIIGEKIGVGGGNVSTSDILSKVSRHFISKRHDDRTPYKLSSDTAFEVGDFVPGSSGAIVYKDKETGQTVGEIDKFYFRMKAYFESLEIVNVNSLGGKQVISPAGSVRLTMVFGDGDKYEIVTAGEDGNDVVEEVTVPQGTYRCFFLAEQDGQEVENRFKVGNQLQSKDFNIKKPGEYNQVANHYYWRLVTGVSTEPVRIGELGYHYVDLSVTDCDTGSDAPAKGDVVAQLGDRNDVDYQNALVFSSVDTFSPSITLYQGINSYSLVGKDAVSYGVDKTTGKAFMNVYGEMYIGDRGGSTFVRYTQDNGVEINGKLAVGTKLGDGKTIEQALEDATQSAIDAANENISNFTDAVTKDIEGLQNQIDGVIESFNGFGAPTLTNFPANEWTTDEARKAHDKDTYTDKTEYVDDVTTPTAGQSWKWQYTSPTDYGWVKIADSDATRALLDAARAQDTADGKRRVFVSQPTAQQAYDVGDLWVNATYGTTYSNDVLRAVTAKAADSPFSINHWTKASKYTDDTKAEQVQQNVNNLSTTVNTLSGTVSGMKDFTDEAFADGVVDRSEASAIDKYLNNINTTKADAQNAYSKVYENALLDGVAKTNLANAYNAFSASATELVTSITNAIADGKTTSTERADVDAKYTNFNTKYGDFVAYLNAANRYIQDKINSTANNALTQIGGLVYLKQALKEDTTIEGGLIQSSVLALGYTNEGGVYKVMSGTNGIYDAASLGGGIASWWGGAMKDRGNYTASDMPSDVAKALVRMDGSGYLANGGIWWGTDGKIHADPQSFIINENQLGDYLELFQIIYKGSTKEIDYIIPQYVMQKVDVASYVTIGGVKLKKHSDGVLEIEGDLLVTGGVTMYAQGSHTASTILDALPIDTTTLSKDGGVLSVIGGGGGSSIAGIKVNGGTYTPGADKYITIPDYPTSLAWADITGKPSWIGDSKPSYSFGELTGKPTTLDGYGITDAVTLNTAQTITGQKIIGGERVIKYSNGMELFSYSATTLNINSDGTTNIAQITSLGIIANAYIARGGTSSQFLKADGSVDSNTYLTESNLDMVLKQRFVSLTQMSTYDSSVSKYAAIEQWLPSTSGCPESYGTALTFRDEATWYYRLAFGVSGNIYYYNGINTTAFTKKGTLAFVENLYSKTESDGRYVKKSGDTMTGPFTIQTGADNKLVFNNTDGEKYTTISFRENGTEYAGLNANSGSYNFYYLPINALYYTANTTTLCSNLNADLLDGYHYNRFVPKSVYSYTSGVTVKTSVSKSSNRMLQFHITGNSYGNYGGLPIDTYVQCYAYEGNTFGHNPSMINNGARIPYVTAFYYDNVVCLYVPNVGNYISLDVYCQDTMGGSGTNLVTYILDSDLRGSGSAVLQINPANSAMTSDNVSSATKLQTARSIWGQSFDGTGNVSGWLSGATTIQCSTGLKSRSVCIETENDGSAGGRNAEINCFSASLYLQHATANNLIVCYGGGNVGIGTTSPSYKLHVAGTVFTNDIFFGNRYSTNNNAAAFVFDKPGSNYTGIGSDGTANTIRLSACDSAGNWVSYEQIWKFYGNILTTGGVTMYSDLRKKNVLGDTSLSLDKICAAPLFRFTYKDDDKSTLHIGSSAQYWQDVPGIVGTDSNGEYLTMDYNAMLSAVTLSLAKYTKKHETEIDKLKKENMKLRQRIEVLERRVA